MTRRHSLVTVAAAAVLAVLAGCAAQPATTHSTASSAPKELTPVTLAMPVFASQFGPYLAAIDKGYYEDAGLKVTVVKLPGSAAIQGLISNSVTFAGAAGSAIPAVLKGAPVINVSINVDSPPYMLVATKQITSLADLKGKQIGIQSPGDSVQIATNALLKLNHIDPGSVTETPVGQLPNGATALSKGAVPAAILNAAALAQLNASNPGQFHVVTSMLGKVVLPVAGTTVSTSYLASHRNIVKAFLEATAKGEAAFLNDKKYGIQLIATQTQDTVANATIDYQYSGTWPVDGSLSTADQKAVIDQYATANGVAAVAPGKVFDFSLTKPAYELAFPSGSKDVVRNVVP